MSGKTDTIKLLFSYGIAAFVIVWGAAYLLIHAAETPNATTLLVGSLMTAAAGFAWNQEVAKSATRASQSSAAGGAATATGTTPPPPTPQESA